MKKGQHWFRPLALKTLKEDTKLTFEFNDSMKVSSPYVNKLFGLSTSLDVHKNSIRVGWRYDAETDFFELTPYIYEGGIRTINATERLYVKAGQEITIELFYIIINI